MISTEGSSINCCYFHQFNHESDGRLSVPSGIFQEVISLYKGSGGHASHYSNIHFWLQNVSPTHYAQRMRTTVCAITLILRALPFKNQILQTVFKGHLQESSPKRNGYC